MPGGFLDQQSPFFQEEFPKLVAGGEEKSEPAKKEEEKEPQYGPGPSLRPQSKYAPPLQEWLLNDTSPRTSHLDDQQYLAHLQNPPPLTNRVVTFVAFCYVLQCIIFNQININ